MKANSKLNTISSNEINKFAYCPYQWYYERLYGTKELKRLAYERNERLGLEDERLSNFRKGVGFHNGFRLESLKGKAAVAVIILILAAVIWFGVKNGVV